MLSSTTSRRFALTALATAAVTIAVPIASGATAAASGHGTAAAHRAGAAKQVIVYVKARPGFSASGRSRAAAARSAQAAVRSQLAAAGATHVVSLSSVHAIVASVPRSGLASLRHSPNVKKVVPDGVIPGATPTTDREGFAGTSGAKAASLKPSLTPPACGTSTDPELDPEALSAIHATPADLGAMDGAGVGVAYMAEGVDTNNPDFQRNAAFASSSSAAGSPVIVEKDFTGDGTNAPTSGGEAFLDASSIAAQGNQTYDLSTYGPVSPVPAGCDIKIVGAAPGANVTGLKIFAENNATTDSDFLQAIQYAVTHHIKVLNESFGSNDFPASSQDVVVNADNDAVKAGVTVVVSSGDSGITSTIGTPASDPKVIGVGATTTFREYEQEGLGATNIPGANGKYVNNNISALSSAGFSQLEARTVDLVAPGDSNWGLCTPNLAKFADCSNDSGDPTGFSATGGTSESAPLTASGAADVIQAYASTHKGKDPSPELVKRVLMSTATDIAAPANQGGAGLLNVKAAIAMAKSIPGTTGTKSPGVLLKPTQINVMQHQGTKTTKKVTVTNTGSASETVHLSTRALTKKLASQSGSFCLQPGHPTSKCPANTGTFTRETGAKQVYQAVHFDVPAHSSTADSRLVFDAAYLNTGQGSVLKVALLEPDGTYAMYSDPQGQGDFADDEVANPPAGQWTAIFFTSHDVPSEGLFGTKGKIRWSADTLGYAAASPIKPAKLTIPAGKSKSATLTLAAPKAAGDVAQSVVVSAASNTTTIPVTQRTLISIKHSVGQFHGVLTGGNGRDTNSQNNAYNFDVPKGVKSIRASMTFANDPGDVVFGGLVDPQGQLRTYDSNASTDEFGQPVQTKSVDLYAAKPQAGKWTVLLTFLDPITGKELSEPFSGVVSFKGQGVSSNLPTSKRTLLKRGKARTFRIQVANRGRAAQAYFVDPRLDKSKVTTLQNLNPTHSGRVPLPLAVDFSTEPTYVVPPETTALYGKATSNAPVEFSMYDGLDGQNDPILSPAVNTPGTSHSVGPNSAALVFKEPEIASGIWYIDPSEIGPYGTGQAPTQSAKVSLRARTPMFDKTVTSPQGDLWQSLEGKAGKFKPRYVPVGDSTTISLTVKPTAKAGTTIHGVAYVDAVSLFSPLSTAANEVVAVPYTYTVKK